MRFSNGKMQKDGVEAVYALPPKTLRKRYVQLQVLYHLSSTLARAENIEAIYRAALDGLEQALGVERSAILMLDADGVMRFKAWRGLSEPYRNAVEGHSPWPPDARRPRPVLIPDAAADPTMQTLRPILQSENIRALAFIPLIDRQSLLGKFMLYYPQPHAFSTEEVQLAQTIAGHVAIAAARKRADEERERLIGELQTALAQVKRLSGLLPICASCKRIRDDQGYWHAVEVYIREHSEAEFTHGICPECAAKLYPSRRPKP